MISKYSGAERGQIIPPGKVIGILGGGQLGRMSAIAAAELGYRTHIFCPEEESPAAAVAGKITCAAYENQDALSIFAGAVDVITFEFENIPLSSAQFLAGLKPFRPKPEILEVTQHRVKEKDFIRKIGLPTTPYLEIESPSDLNLALSKMGVPAILKTARFGYDGKGQAAVKSLQEAKAAWMKIGQQGSAIWEKFIPFQREISVIVARTLGGETAVYECAENSHSHNILHHTALPAAISPVLAEAAQSIARQLAETLDLCGLLAVEMFVVDDRTLLINELAPRPHNSGHWSQDAAVTSQFEQFIRAVCGLPLGAPDRLCPVTMTNLLGNDINNWKTFLKDPRNKLHLYGKSEPRPGRKMGHVNRLHR